MINISTLSKEKRTLLWARLWDQQSTGFLIPYILKNNLLIGRAPMAGAGGQP